MADAVSSKVSLQDSIAPLDDPPRHKIAILSNNYLMVPVPRKKKKRLRRYPGGIPPANKLLGRILFTRYRIGAVLFLAAALAAAIFYDTVLAALLEWQLQLSPHNLFTWFAWYEIPIKLRFYAFLFGLRNPDQFLQGAKPELVEHGPYVLDVSRTRTVIEWTNQTVIFTERFGVRFQPKLSSSLNDRIQGINPVIVCAMGLIRYQLRQYGVRFIDPVINNIVLAVLRISGEPLVSKNTAREFLFGRSVPMLSFLERLTEPFRMLGINLAVPFTKYGDYHVTNNTFGLFSVLQASTFGPMEHYRRSGPGHKANEVFRIEGRTTYDNYRPPCNKIRGVDPLIFGQNLQPPQPIDIYNEHFCRTFTLTYNKTHYVKGILAQRYLFWPDTYDQSFRENQCYCWGERTLAECDGYTDISACLNGIPIAISFPHFYRSRRLQSGVVGLRPNSDRHQGYMDIEPHIGVPVSAHLTLQFNIIYHRSPLLAEMRGIRPGVVPFFWLEAFVRLETPLFELMLVCSLLLNWGKPLLIGSLLLVAAWLWYQDHQQQQHYRGKIDDSFRKMVKKRKETRSGSR